MTSHTLLLVNRSSGMSHDEATVGELSAMLRCAFATRSVIETAVVDDHQAAAQAVSAFLARDVESALIIVGGGSGTLRAAIEAIFGAAERSGSAVLERVRIAALRMGSGNIFAKQFGVPKDTRAALQGIIDNALADRTSRTAIVRCASGNPARGGMVMYGASLVGLGTLGSVPDQLKQWRLRHPWLRQLGVRLLGIEAYNGIEYVALFAAHLIARLFRSDGDLVEVESQNFSETLPLAAGVVMNFPVQELPIRSSVRAEDNALSMALLPHHGAISTLACLLAPAILERTARRIEIHAGESVVVRSRRPIGFFVDEDNETFDGELNIRVAGTLGVVPGPDYTWQERKVVS